MCAINLDVAEHLVNGPLSINELEDKMKCPKDKLGENTVTSQHHSHSRPPTSIPYYPSCIRRSVTGSLCKQRLKSRTTQGDRIRRDIGPGIK